MDNFYSDHVDMLNKLPSISDGHWSRVRTFETVFKYLSYFIKKPVHDVQLATINVSLMLVSLVAVRLFLLLF